ncbi:MAG: DHA2 family efflux MFS transporter permease subunit [Hyphomicrobium aestuarii]|nr:DHA2 family efflux MFS transporter permease subunit [Hyphomicrobium aestuarii]
MPADTSPVALAPPTATLTTWAGFSILCLGMFMAILDIQIVATSLPDIQSALGIAPSQMSWVQTSYLIAEVIAIPLTGLLTRALSLRWLFVAAIAVFTVASVGCASSTTFAELVSWRIVQGFAGGMLIPIVFSAVFLMFPERSQALATTIAGVLAVLAPTVGPLVGGYITSTYSWQWLFLINVPAGLVSIVLAPRLLPRGAPVLALLTRLDVFALVTIAVALATLEIGLKEAPLRGWLSGVVLGLLGMSLALGAIFVVRTMRRGKSGRANPLVDLTNCSDRNFAIGCALSFVLGISLFGSVYLMPVFLVFVRGHDAFEAGQIMLVTGLAQLATAPIAVYLERRVDPRLLTGFGFGLLAIGVGLSAFQTTATGFDEMLLPQILRGVAFMFCLLPPTRMALGRLPLEKVPDASALFNLMRNLGGAIGLALIDTVLYGRAPGHATALAARLKSGDVTAAREVGIPEAEYLRGLAEGIDGATEIAVRNAVERSAATTAGNEAWAMMAVLTGLALLIVPFCRAARVLPPPATPSDRRGSTPVH